jgi:hypothetical protein
MASAGLFLLTRLQADSQYVSGVLPAILLMSLGMGLVFVPLSATALFGVGNHDAGVASAVLNTAQQIGGALGTAFLNTIATSATATYMVVNNLGPITLPTGRQVPPVDAQVHGFTTAFHWSAGIVLLGAVVWGLMVNANKDTLSANDSAAAHIG